jgi:hypothetical protein
MPSNQERDDQGLLKKGAGYKNLTGTDFCYRIGQSNVKLVDRISGHGQSYSLDLVYPGFSQILERGDDCRPAITPEMLRNTVLAEFDKFLLTKTKKK